MAYVYNSTSKDMHQVLVEDRDAHFWLSDCGKQLKHGDYTVLLDPFALRECKPCPECFTERHPIRITYEVR